VPKPPQSTPHSDLEGVHKDEKRNVDSANDAGEDSGDLEQAHRRSRGRPSYTDDQPDREDRTH
jgi:hypothetical protein